MSDPLGGAPAAAPTGLRTTSAKGFVYTLGRAFINRGLSLVSFVILGRLLAPEDYGLVALANVFVLLLSILAASGYSQVLVQRPSVERADLDTIFWIALTTGIGLAVLLSAAAWPLADVYGEPQLRPVLQVLSVMFISIAFSSTHQAVLQRRLEFKTLARAAIWSNVVATAVGVLFAFLGFGVWALVVQTVLGQLVNTAMIVRASGYRPGREASLARFWPMFEFSRNYLGSSLLVFLNQRTADFLIGSVLGATALGIYAVAFRILSVMIEVLSNTIRQVAFPVFSRMQQDRVRMRRGYMSATQTCAVASVPAFLFCMVTSPELVLFPFGAKWNDAVPIMRVLCFFGALQAVLQFNATVLQSLGYARLIFRLGVAGTALQIVAFAITVHLGLLWVAVSFTARAYLLAPVGLYYAAKALDMRVRDTVSGIAAPLMATAVMVGALFAVRAPLGPQTNDLALLAISLPVGVGVYVLTLRLIGRRAFDETLSFVRDAVGRQPKAVSA